MLKFGEPNWMTGVMLMWLDVLNLRGEYLQDILKEELISVTLQTGG